MRAYVGDTLAMLVRHQRNFLRQPIWIVFALTQPMFWLLLYSQLFRRIVDLPGFDTDSYVKFLTPGIVVMTAFFGATWSGMSMIDDLDRGERSVWRMVMVDAQGNEVAPIEIRRDRRPEFVIRSEFPHFGDFSKAYVATFPRDAKLLGEGVEQVALRLSSSRGGIELTWHSSR